MPTSVGVSSSAEVFLLGAKPALLTQPFAGTRNSGRILITDSIAGYTPGAFQAVYHGTKAFIDSFSYALRNELKDTDVTVTCLMPGATETEFFERADMMDTNVGTEKKQPADEVARIGFEAMMKGEGDVVTGWSNKLRAAIARVMPSSVLAEQHPQDGCPGHGRQAVSGPPSLHRCGRRLD